MSDNLCERATKRSRNPQPQSEAAPQLFVLRTDGPMQGFCWEIRPLSIIVLERSRDVSKTADLARADGKAALVASR